MRTTEINMTEATMIMAPGDNINGTHAHQNSVMITEVKDIIGKLQWDQAMLRQAIDASLRDLGEPVMKTVLWHLKMQGIFLDSNDRINMRLFYEHLTGLIGDAAVLVMDEIVNELIKADKSRLMRGQ